MEPPPTNKTWDPNPDTPSNCTFTGHCNCSFSLVDSRRDVKVGRTIQDEIVYVIRIEKSYCELDLDGIKGGWANTVIQKKFNLSECSISGIDYLPDLHPLCKSRRFTDHLITVNHSGVVIDDDILRDEEGWGWGWIPPHGWPIENHLEAYDDLSCLSC